MGDWSVQRPGLTLVSLKTCHCCQVFVWKLHVWSQKHSCKEGSFRPSAGNWELCSLGLDLSGVTHSRAPHPAARPGLLQGHMLISKCWRYGLDHWPQSSGGTTPVSAPSPPRFPFAAPSHGHFSHRGIEMVCAHRS